MSAKWDSLKFDTNTELHEALAGMGWEVLCFSPLEIAHADGSSADGLAASYLLDGLIEELNQGEQPLE